ncbi:MAG: haloalkane dehalogenase [Mycobacterium sp.]|uniref:haloalkane dehalogenase n=1 Tax=Mycobacterium sp. TaxID=1785 RepID=UPI003F94F18F
MTFIDPDAPLTKQPVAVLDRTMAYHTRGQGPAILLLHGNPTSSYLWRNVVPQLEGSGRLIAPDLIGMGDSDKLEPADAQTYTFATHRRYLWEFIDRVVGDQPVVLVIHDWGSALGFDWAHHHPERVRAIAYMEGIVRPLAGWHEWSADAVAIFQAFRSPAGEDLILNRNLFIERVLPGSVLGSISDAAMSEYRRPFLQPEHRWPTLSWPRSIPIAGEPADVVDVVDAYARWLMTTDTPKLFINADPGAILTGPVRDFARRFPNQQEVTVPGSHFIQEDSGPEIGSAIRDWLTGLPTRGHR